MSRNQADSLTNEYVVTFNNNKYPFNANTPSPLHTSVKLCRHYQPEKYEQLSKAITMHSNLKHCNLIAIRSVFESKKHKQFDIFYEYVENSLVNRIVFLRKQEIQLTQIRLLELVHFLITHNFNPPINADTIGINSRGVVKYYLDFDLRPSPTKLQSKELLKTKRQEIQQLFENIANQPRQNGYCSNDNKSNVSKSTTKLPSKYFYQNSTQLEAGSTITQIFNKISEIDTKIKELEMATNNKSNVKFKQKHSYITKPDSSRDLTKKHPTIQIPKRIQLPQRNKSKGLSPKSSGDKKWLEVILQKDQSPRKKKKQFDQESFDTYRQELGDDVEMPKITSTKLRQTANSPPKSLFLVKNNSKLHDSMGKKDTHRILSAVNSDNRSDIVRMKQATSQRSPKQNRIESPKASFTKKQQIVSNTEGSARYLTQVNNSPIKLLRIQSQKTMQTSMSIIQRRTLINERVKQACQKSEATLSHYQRGRLTTTALS